MNRKVSRLLSVLLVIVLLIGMFNICASASEIIAPCKMESTLDIYAGAYYYNNLRNPVVKGDDFKVVCLEWVVNHSKNNYTEDFSYSSTQKVFGENSTYYLRLTLHSLDYPNKMFSSSNNVEDFSGFTVSLKVNGKMVELSPHAVRNYDDTHEYIDLFYEVKTDVAENKVPVTGVYSMVTTILVGQKFIFADNVMVQPANATNQYIEWRFLDGYDGGTNYGLNRTGPYIVMEPLQDCTPKPGEITLVAMVPNGKADGGLFSTTIKIRVVSDISLQGNVYIPSTPVVGEEIKVALDGDVKNVSDIKYSWEYKNSLGQFDDITKVKNYGQISNNILKPGIGLVGKEIRLKITSKTYMGAVVSESKIVQKNSVMASPCVFKCGFSQSFGVCAKINSETLLLQEFVMLKSSTPPTEEQWKTLSKTPTKLEDLYFSTDENGAAITGSTTYTIYSRFKATDTSSAGTEVISATYYTGFTCPMDVFSIKLVYDKVEYESYDTIVLDLKGQSSVTFNPQIITGPTNANEWKKHVWKITGSETANFSGVGNTGGPYYTTLNYQNGDEYYNELKAVFTKQGKYYLSADIDGSADKYGYYNIVVVDSTKHIDEYVVSVRPSNITPTSLTIEQNEVMIPSFVSMVSIYPVVAQKDYKIIYKEATYKSGSYGVPYTITDNAYIDVDEETGAITGVKKTGSASNEKGYMVLCKYDTTTQKMTIVSGFTVTVSEPTHTHYLTKISARQASCTDTGYSRDFYVCSCGEWFSDSNASQVISDHGSCVIDELGHEYGDFISEVEPTWDTDGAIGHYHCSRCGKNFDSSKNELESILITKLSGESSITAGPDATNQPQTTENSENGDNDKHDKTGDNSNRGGLFVVFGVIFIVLIAVIIIFIVKKKKR